MPLPDGAITATLKTEEGCIAYLEALRWPHGVSCPNCGNTKISRFQTKGKSGKSRQVCQCLDKECKYQFSVTTETIFHDSHLPLSKWFEAMRLLTDPSTPTSVNQLRFVLGVQYKTAKNVAERIQRALHAGTIELSGAALRRPEAELGRAVQAAEAPVRQSRSLKKSVESRKRRSQLPPLTPPIATPGSPNQTVPTRVSPTLVDSMLSVFTTALNLSAKPPLAAVKYLKKKIMED